MRTAGRGKPDRADRMLMLALAALSSVFTFLTLDKGHVWGDDFAAYLAEGIAISKGAFAGQAALGGAIVGAPGPVVYVWGYPLLLAGVHQLAGFDINGFGSLILYKVPAAACLAAWGPVLYRFYRGRFGRWPSFASAMLFACNPLMLGMANEIMTDIPFALLAWAALSLAYRFLDGAGRAPIRRAGTGALLGAVIFLAYVTRYAGAALLAVLAAAQTAELFRARRVARGPSGRGNLAAALAPHLAFLALYLVIGLFAPYAKTQAGDMAKASLPALYENLLYYLFLLDSFVQSFVPFQAYPVTSAILFVTALGLRDAFKKELPAALFLLGTLAALLSLPYIQGMRYLLPVLPCVPLFFLHGARRVQRWLLKARGGRFVRVARALRYALPALALAVMLAGSAARAAQNLERGRVPPDGAYSQSAMDMYRYIRENIPPDQAVAFNRGRALSLNTGRLCYALFPDTKGNLAKAGYLLLSPEPDAALQFDLGHALGEYGLVIRPARAIGSLTLYRLEPGPGGGHGD